MVTLRKIINWPRTAIRRTYDWMMRWALTKQATWALAGFSFAESSFFPIPPDPLLIATVSARPSKWWRLAAICTAASVLGGVFGWLIGYGLFESVGQPIIDSYGLQAEFDSLGSRYEANALLTIFTAAFTPIPYKVITISAGVFKINLLTLLLGSTIGRAGRFFIVAWLSQKLGTRYQEKIAKYIDVISLAFVSLLILGFIALRYL